MPKYNSAGGIMRYKTNLRGVDRKLVDTLMKIDAVRRYLEIAESEQKNLDYRLEYLKSRTAETHYEMTEVTDKIRDLRRQMRTFEHELFALYDEKLKEMEDEMI